MLNSANYLTMQLLPLLLPALLVLAVLAQDSSSPRPRGRGNRRGKTITDETKKSMGRNLGLNMEERRARLEKFNKAPKLTAEQKAQLKERIAVSLTTLGHGNEFSEAQEGRSSRNQANCSSRSCRGQFQSRGRSILL